MAKIKIQETENKIRVVTVFENGNLREQAASETPKEEGESDASFSERVQLAFERLVIGRAQSAQTDYENLVSKVFNKKTDKVKGAVEDAVEEKLADMRDA